MKVIIAGSRDISDIFLVEDAIKKSKFDITEVITGTTTGVDSLACDFAKMNELCIRFFRCDWLKNKEKAWEVVNTRMASYADALIAVWDGKSRGTRHMILEAQKAGLQIFIYTVK